MVDPSEERKFCGFESYRWHDGCCFEQADAIIAKYIAFDGEHIVSFVFLAMKTDVFLVRFVEGFGRWAYIIPIPYTFREEFHAIVLSLEKLHRDSGQLIKGGSSQTSLKQLQQRIGLKPSLADCLDGLKIFHDMHFAEYVKFLGYFIPIIAIPDFSNVSVTMLLHSL